MADIKTLDQRIREDAREKLRDRVEAAIYGLNPLLRWSSGAVMGLESRAGNGDPIPADIHVVIKRLGDHLFATNVEREERQAIEAFMQRVETLQEQVNELRSLSHEHD